MPPLAILLTITFNIYLICSQSSLNTLQSRPEESFLKPLFKYHLVPFCFQFGTKFSGRKIFPCRLKILWISSSNNIHFLLALTSKPILNHILDFLIICNDFLEKVSFQNSFIKSRGQKNSKADMFSDVLTSFICFILSFCFKRNIIDV